MYASPLTGQAQIFNAAVPLANTLFGGPSVDEQRLINAEQALIAARTRQANAEAVLFEGQNSAYNDFTNQYNLRQSGDEMYDEGSMIGSILRTTGENQDDVGSLLLALDARQPRRTEEDILMSQLGAGMSGKDTFTGFQQDQARQLQETQITDATNRYNIDVDAVTERNKPLSMTQWEAQRAQQMFEQGDLSDQHLLEILDANPKQPLVKIGDEQGRYEPGTIPQGFMFDHQLGEMSAIPGGPAAIEQQQLEEKQAQTAQSRIDYAAPALDSIKDMYNLLDNDWVLNPAVGFGSGVAGKVGGTNSSNMQALLNTLQAFIGFDRLQAMRDASPTGGALGQVSERELDQLNAAYGALSQAQSEDQFRNELDKVNRMILETVHGPAPDGSPTVADEALQGQPGGYGGNTEQQDDPLGLR